MADESKGNAKIVYEVVDKFYLKLNEFRASSMYCDVNIRVGEKLFPCHRVVLASALEYFNAMFGGNYKESNEEEVLLDVDVLAFEEILNYIYTGNITITSENAFRLLSLSELLHLEYVTGLCAVHIEKNLPIHNAVEILIFAHNTNKESLVSLLTEYIAIDFIRMSKLNSILEVPFRLLQTIIAHENLEKDSDSIIDFFGRWTRYKIDERKQILPDLMRLISLDDITLQCLSELIIYNKIPLDSPDIDENDSVDEDEKSNETLDRRASLDVYVRHENVSTFIYTMKEKEQWKFGRKPSFMNGNSGDSDILWKSVVLNDHFFNFGRRLFMQHTARLLYCSRCCCSRCCCKNIPDNLFNLQLNGSLEYIKLSAPDLSILSDFSITTTNDLIYLYISDSEEDLDCFHVYHCDLDKWFAVPTENPYLRTKHACVTSLGNLLYVFSGFNFSNALTTTTSYGLAQSYDSKSGKWIKLPPMAHQHANAAACTHKGKCYITGGEHLSYYQKIVEVYDPVAGKWNTVAPMTQMKKGHVLVSYGDYLWAIGGYKNDLKACKYDPKTDKWADISSLDYAVGELTNPSSACVTHAIVHDLF